MHPSYAYEDFVRGMGTADREGGGIHFEPKDRVVLELALVAEAVAPRPVILIMDEINRCSLASVLGELILALEPDKRGREIRLQHGGAVKIPKNLWFIGTMNTADRSIALVDYAIRRRFRFIDVPPSEEALDSFYADKQARPEQVQAAKEAMNAIGVKIGPPNLKVGPSYFMEHPTEPTGLPWPERMADRLIYEVLPLLREYSREDSSVVTGPIEIGAARIDVTEQVAEDFEAKHRSAIRAFFAAQKP
jgi:5-methylcytosine-specific restriction protein B